MRTMRPPRSATPEPVDPESVSPSGPRRAAKQAALVLLCLLWIAVGLIGHDPWKNDDATTFGVADGSVVVMISLVRGNYVKHCSTLGNEFKTGQSWP